MIKFGELLKKWFWRFIQILWIGDLDVLYAHSTQSPGWPLSWLMGQTVYPSFVGLSSFYTCWNCVIGQWEDGKRREPYTHLIDGSRKELCSSYISKHVLFKQVELPGANCRTVWLPVLSSCCCQSFYIKKWRGGRAADRFFHVVEKWQTTYLCRPPCCAAVDSSGNAISARHLGRPPLLLAIYIIPADSRGIFQKRRDDPSSFPVLQSIVLRGNIAARLMHNKFHTMLSNQQELSDVTAGSLYRECRSNHLTIETSV